MTHFLLNTQHKFIQDIYSVDFFGVKYSLQCTAYAHNYHITLHSQFGSIFFCSVFSFLYSTYYTVTDGCHRPQRWKPKHSEKHMRGQREWEKDGEREKAKWNETIQTDSVFDKCQKNGALTHRLNVVSSDVRCSVRMCCVCIALVIIATCQCQPCDVCVLFGTHKHSHIWVRVSIVPVTDYICSLYFERMSVCVMIRRQYIHLRFELKRDIVMNCYIDCLLQII